jgi:1,5-anhydro-D-fructose reductase (1,5-anhydro-D-mannitol-forming)
MALGWGIVGIGSHPNLKVAPAMRIADGSELVAVCGRGQGRTDTFAEAHGAKAAYTSIDDLLRDSRVDAVFVASPNSLHAPQTIQAANAGKQVLSEKPMATAVEDAVAMVRACRSNGVKLGIGFELRFHPAHLFARELVAKGAIGRIRLAHGQWARGERGASEHLPRTGLREW